MKKWLQHKGKLGSRLRKSGLGGGLIRTGGMVTMLLVIPMIMYLGFLLMYMGKIYPGVSVSGLDVSGFESERVWRSLQVLEDDYLAQDSLKVVIEDDGVASESSVLTYWIDFDEINLKYEPISTTNKVLAFGRNGKFFDKVYEQLLGLSESVEFNHEFGLDDATVELFVELVADDIDRPGAMPDLRMGTDGLEVFRGENGFVLDKGSLKNKILKAFGELDLVVDGVEMKIEENEVTHDEAMRAVLRGEKLIDKFLTINMVDDEGGVVESWVLEGNELVGFVGFDGDFNKVRLEKYVESLAEGIEREPENATFQFEGGKVVEFSPGRDGIKVVESQSVLEIAEALEAIENNDPGEATVKLAVRNIPPALESSDVNDLGVTELLGRGESTYRGSIAGRVHNVALTASRLNGVLIAPGETFSFNQTIGDVSRATGYQSAYVIMDGRTVLGDGGGVCQDSTTLFRAVMNAGLPITERKSHSYRVGYYEQNSEPGFDATVYAPSPDFKFTNDTGNHVLIQAKADSSSLSLVIELYGTSDGRKSSIVNYAKWGHVPAPPPLYQDDPTLGPGVVKQVDWAAPGLNVKFDYVVERDGETVFEKTFYSNYRPWQAVYLRGV